MPSGLDSTKTEEQEPIESTLADPNSANGTPEERVDKTAMEMAKRAQNRIHADETVIPGSSIFTK